MVLAVLPPMQEGELQGGVAGLRAQLEEEKQQAESAKVGEEGAGSQSCL